MIVSEGVFWLRFWIFERTLIKNRTIINWDSSTPKNTNLITQAAEGVGLDTQAAEGVGYGVVTV